MTAPPRPGLVQAVGLRSATALVVASMIGAGIFTTTGFQAADLGHPGWIFALWVVGGILALCGALSFAELGAMMPRAGAEYVYIREAFGHTAAFMSAFVALIAGFSAPIAVALKSLVQYLGYFVPAFADNAPVAGVGANDLAAIVLVWILVAIHSAGVRAGLGFTDIVTAIKVLGIVAIIVAAFAFGSGDASGLTYVSTRYTELSTLDLFARVATALIFVNFCYLGWNGAAYMAAEMPDPQRQLPRALLGGTILVTLLYLGLNAVYLYGADVDHLVEPVEDGGVRGLVEVGLVSSRVLFGPTGVSLVTALLCVSILASASAMTAVGPRVYYAFAQDFPPVAWLGRVGPRSGAPVLALQLQGVVTTVLVLSGRVDQILQYAGFTLTLFASLAVSCVIVLRIRRPDAPRPFRAWGYPFTPVLFLAVSAWTMVWAVRGRPVESILGMATAALGGILCAIALRFRRAS
jgi:APA family basic amino acid/polyamine antiporter